MAKAYNSPLSQAITDFCNAVQAEVKLKMSEREAEHRDMLAKWARIAELDIECAKALRPELDECIAFQQSCAGIHDLPLPSAEARKEVARAERSASIAQELLNDPDLQVKRRELPQARIAHQQAKQKICKHSLEHVQREMQIACHDGDRNKAAGWKSTVKQYYPEWLYVANGMFEEFFG